MFNLKRLMQLNFTIGIAIAKAANDLGVKARVKWPNDVWVGNKKIAGVIVDAKTRIGGIAGFGINVNQDVAADTDISKVATSLSHELNAQVSREEVLAKVCANIEHGMQTTFTQTLKDYSQFDMLIGTTVRVHHKTREETDARDYDALVLGVNEKGNLRVKPVGKSGEKELSGEEVSISPEKI